MGSIERASGGNWLDGYVAFGRRGVDGGVRV